MNLRLDLAGADQRHFFTFRWPRGKSWCLRALDAWMIQRPAVGWWVGDGRGLGITDYIHWNQGVGGILTVERMPAKLWHVEVFRETWQLGCIIVPICFSEFWKPVFKHLIFYQALGYVWIYGDGLSLSTTHSLQWVFRTARPAPVEAGIFMWNVWGNCRWHRLCLIVFGCTVLPSVFSCCLCVEHRWCMLRYTGS